MSAVDWLVLRIVDDPANVTEDRGQSGKAQAR